VANADFDDDLDVFFDDDDFAIAGTVAGTFVGNVIFDRDYLRALGMVSSTRPQCLARGAQYGTAVLDGTLVCSEGSFRIVEREPQDDGKVVLLDLEVL
jgi:hypothetical protein